MKGIMDRLRSAMIDLLCDDLMGPLADLRLNAGRFRVAVLSGRAATAAVHWTAVFLDATRVGHVLEGYGQLGLGAGNVLQSFASSELRLCRAARVVTEVPSDGDGAEGRCRSAIGGLMYAALYCSSYHPDDDMAAGPRP